MTLLLGAALLTGVGLASPTASASPTLTVSPTTSLLAPPNATTALTGLAVSGDTTDTLQATVATTLGTVSISLTTNLTLAFGNSWSGTASITFTGRQADIDAALDSAALTTGGTTATADISLTALVAQPGFDYLAANQHFYEYVPCAACSWFSADADAQALSLDGQPGYLATIPNATVNSFISTKIANATNVWFGARAYESLATDGTQADAVVNGVTYARVWRWTEGAGESPIAGGVISECTNQLTTCSFQNAGSLYSSWASGEPNNDSGSTTVAYVGEYAAVTNWNGTSGDWNDLNPTDDSSVSGYVAEFGGKTNSDASLGTGFAGVVTTTAGVLVAASASVPSAPVVTAVAGDAAATLSWNPPATNGAAITGYEVSTDGGVTWHAVATTTATTVANGNAVVTVTATVSGLTDGTTYSVEVRADNSAGPSVASTPRSVTPVDLVRTGGSTAATPAGAGYWNLLPGGTLSAHGNADLLGSENGASLAAPVVGVCSTITGDGYWETASDGGVFSFGDAHFYGALPPTTPAAPVVAMTRTP
ncbi:MAG: fibronectin type III domain-containing protein, partial [Acidimicrobiales bacterium]